MIVLSVFIILMLFLFFKSKKYQWIEWGNPLFNFLDGLNRWFSVKYHHLKSDDIPYVNFFENDEEKKQGVILVSNHVSGLDPFLIAAASKRPLRYLIAREQYERKAVYWLFKHLNYIPVDRNMAKSTSDSSQNSKSKNTTRNVLAEAAKALQGGDVVCIYPQGGIVSTGQNLGKGHLSNLKKGAFKLAAESGAPLVITTISGINAKKGEFRSMFARSKAKINYHTTIYVNENEVEEAIQKVSDIFVEQHSKSTLKTLPLE